MKFLAVSTNTGDPRPHIEAETVRMGELAAAGTVERVLMKADWSGVVLILDVTDAQAAHAALDSLPVVAHGLTAFALTEVVDPPS